MGVFGQSFWTPSLRPPPVGSSSVEPPPITPTSVGSSDQNCHDISGIPKIKIVLKNYTLKKNEKWAGVDDVENNTVCVKTLIGEWDIVAFKMHACDIFDDIESGFWKMSGSGYDHEIQEISSVNGIGHRFVITILTVKYPSNDRSLFSLDGVLTLLDTVLAEGSSEGSSD